MVLDRSNYVLRWRPVPAGWLPGRPGAASWEAMPMPFLDPAAQPASAQPSALLCGILYAWHEMLHRFADRDGCRALALSLFSRFSARLRAASPADAMSLLCDRSRARHGPLVSARMLYAARGLCPRENRLRIALVHDVWRLLAHAEHMDVESACEAIVEAARDVDPAGLEPGVVEGLDFVHCVALHVLGRRHELAELFWRTAGPRARAPAARMRLARLLERRDGAIDLLRAQTPAASLG